MIISLKNLKKNGKIQKFAEERQERVVEIRYVEPRYYLARTRWIYY